MQSLWLLSFPSKALGIHAIKSLLLNGFTCIFLQLLLSLLSARPPWGSCSDKNTVVNESGEARMVILFWLVSCFFVPEWCHRVKRGSSPTIEGILSLSMNDWNTVGVFYFLLLNLKTSFPRSGSAVDPYSWGDRKSSQTQSPLRMSQGEPVPGAPGPPVRPAPSMHAEVTFTPNFSEF